MRPHIGHPNYVYVPMSEERRARLREAHRQRLGNKKGHHRVYDVQVPDNIWADVRRYANALKRDGVDLVTINLIIRLFVNQKWLISDRPARLRIAVALTRL